MARAFTIPRHRLDGLTDAVFGVAMTLLVLDLRLPEAAHFKNVSELLHALLELSTQFLTYVISFFVLGCIGSASRRFRLAPRSRGRRVRTNAARSTSSSSPASRSRPCW